MTMNSYYCHTYCPNFPLFDLFFAKVIVTQAVEREREVFSFLENKFSYYTQQHQSSAIKPFELVQSKLAMVRLHDIQPVNGKYGAQTRTYSAIVHRYCAHSLYLDHI